MANCVVGLEISPGLIRYVVAKKTGRKKATVEKFGSLTNSIAIDQQGRVSNVEELATTLRGLWKLEDINCKTVALGVGGKDVFVRDFVVPAMSKGDLQEALPVLAEGSLAMPSSELILDFHPLEITQQDDKASVRGLLLAASSEVCETLAAAVRGANLSVGSIDLVPFALLRMLNSSNETGEEGAARVIVHYSGGTLNIAATQNSKPMFVRSMPLAISPTSADFGRLLTRQVVETLSYYRSISPNLKFAELLLSLDHDADQELENELQELTSVSVVMAQSAGSMPAGKKSRADEPTEIPTEFSVALALAEGALDGN
jgi:type IV pilus assembly protein PilM